MKDDKLAVIDLGTNTFHLLLVQLNERGGYQVADKYREMVKLGEGGFDQGVLAPDAWERGQLALENFSRIINTKGASRVLATATSAIRSASNGPDFVAEAKRRSGIDIRVINGNEEAALIYEGVRAGVHLPVHEDVLIVDIGGGSVEFIVANRSRAKLLRSLRIGAARMLEFVNGADPLRPADITRANELLNQQLGPLIDELKDFKLAYLVGSSGSFETMGALISNRRRKKATLPVQLNGFRFSREEFEDLHLQLMRSTRAQRMEMKGMEEARVDMILMGSLLVQYLLQRLPVQEIEVCEYALKEGLLQTYLKEHFALAENHTSTELDLRKSSIQALAEKYGYSGEHGKQCSRLALQIFDQTEPLHKMGATERELLHYAALLHDIGHFINRSSHHKHGQYILMNSAMPGFSPDELLVLGNVIRYHRKSMPSTEHMHYNLLYKDDKERVNRLAGILRLADNLDRSRRSLVKKIEARMGPKQVELLITAPAAADLDVETAAGVRDMFEQAFDVKLALKRV